MYEIGKRFEFSASHQLDHLPVDHKCHRLHGHNYTVTVCLQASQLSSDGFVVDYADLSELDTYIKTRLDHRHLNEVLGGSHATSAENLAEHFFTMCKGMSFGPYVKEVTVKETEKTWATYSN